MPRAYVPLASTTLASAVSIVTFSSINQGFRDLVLTVSGTITTGTASFYVFFNGDTSSSVAINVTLESNGSASYSAAQGAWYAIWGPYNYNTVLSTTQSVHQINVMDYSQNDKHKSVLMKSTNPATAIGYVAGRWGNTAPITSIAFVTTASTLTAGTTVSLFGVLA